MSEDAMNLVSPNQASTSLSSSTTTTEHQQKAEQQQASEPNETTNNNTSMTSTSRNPNVNIEAANSHRSASEGAGGGTGASIEVTSAATAPVTPKSFHSTRSSFKKSSLPPVSGAAATAATLVSGAATSSTSCIAVATAATTTAAGGSAGAATSSHIYDYPSSLNSSRSSLHRLAAATATGGDQQSSSVQHGTSISGRGVGAGDHHGFVMVSGIGLDNVYLAEDPEIISFSESANVVVKEPIVIRGAGNLTIFGVCNKFSEQFPTSLNAKLAPEEFRDTIKQINSILNKELENSFKWLVVGSLFCCCTLGCSLLPVIYLNKKAKLCINKLLEFENQRLYKKLGLRWRLTKLKCNSNNLFEYVLVIEFLPVLSLYQPD